MNAVLNGCYEDESFDFEGRNGAFDFRVTQEGASYMEWDTLSLKERHKLTVYISSKNHL